MAREATFKVAFAEVRTSAMTDTQRQVTPIDGNEPGAAGLHAQAAQLEGVLERLRVLTAPDSVERAMLVATLEKLLPDEEE